MIVAVAVVVVVGSGLGMDAAAAVAVVVAAMIAPAWVIVGVMCKGELDGRHFTTKMLKKCHETLRVGEIFGKDGGNLRKRCWKSSVISDADFWEFLQ